MPVPDGPIYVTFTSTTDSTKIWKLKLSNDAVGTYNSTTFKYGATVTFTPKSIVNADPVNCTLCVVELTSGPSNWLPNDVYTSQLSFHVASGETVTSLTGSLTTSFFAMPPKFVQSSNPTNDAIKYLETTFPSSVNSTSKPYWVFTPKQGCTASTVTLNATGGLSANVVNKLTLDSSNPAGVTITSTFAFTTDFSLVRGCDYSVTSYWKSALLLPPLPDDPAAPWSSSTLASLKLATLPEPPTASMARLPEGAAFEFTSGFDGYSNVLNYWVKFVKQIDGVDGSQTRVLCGIRGTCRIDQLVLSTDSTYKVYVSAENGLGDGTYAFVDTLVLQHCTMQPRAGINWSGCNLHLADHSAVDFSGSNFSNANFSGAKLASANLTNVNLNGASLSDANLSGVNLTGVDLGGADLTGANLAGAHGSGILNAETATLPAGWAVVDGTIGTYSGPPSSITVTRGNRKFTVNWGTPSAPSAIFTQGFNVRAVGSSQSFTCDNVHGLTCDIEGLTPGSDYEISATSVNQAGEGPRSDPQTVRAISVADAPEITDVLARNSSAVVTWVAPAVDGGASVTGYTVTSTPGNRTCTTSVLTVCLITELTNGTEYTFTVTATNEAGESAASAQSETVVPRAKLAAPTNISAVKGVKNANVSWTAVTTVGHEVMGYAVYSIPGSKSCVTEGTSCVVTNLTPGQAYKFRVVAITTEGITSTAQTAITLLAGDVPGVPTNFKVVSNKGTSLFTWNAPVNDGGSAVTSYVVTVLPGNKTCTTAITTTCTIRGLAKGKTFTAKISVTTSIATTTAPRVVTFKAN